MRGSTEVGKSRLLLAKGSIKGIQLLCPKKWKGCEAWWAGHLWGFLLQEGWSCRQA